MKLSTLTEWLAWIEQVHSTEIDLGLERVKAVGERLQILSPACPVITVGGTNGKGSTVAGLEAIYLAANYRTVTFTSPFLFKPNEQVRLNGEMVGDAELCDAFARVEEARGETPLTPFEFFTLAALIVFKQHAPDIMILEVGLGGRLDAVNIIDANVAVIASIGIDHVSWLGHTRELIGFEKAGIFRSERPVVCGDFDPPNTLIEAAASISAPFYQQGRDFDFIDEGNSWRWQSESAKYDHLPKNALALQNLSSVLMAVTLLQTHLPVSAEAVVKGLLTVKLPGRIQIVPGEVTEIYDVSHNPAAIAFLIDKLKSMPCTGQTYAVFSMLADKDIINSILSIRDWMDEWFVAPLKGKRAAPMTMLEDSFTAAGVNQVCFFDSIQAAYDQAVRVAKPGDRLLIFGSFHTVSDVWLHKMSKQTG